MSNRIKSRTVLKFKTSLARLKHTHVKLFVLDEVPSIGPVVKEDITHFTKRVGGQLHQMYTLLDTDALTQKVDGADGLKDAIFKFVGHLPKNRLPKYKISWNYFVFYVDTAVTNLYDFIDEIDRKYIQPSLRGDDILYPILIEEII